MPTQDRRTARKLSFGMTALLGGVMLTAMPLTSAYAADAKIVVKTQDDLPRFSYSVPDTATALLTADDKSFGIFAAKVSADIEATLTHYDIRDSATLRGLLGVRLSLQVLAGNEDKAALETVLQIRALEDKPDARLLSGLRTEAILNARTSTGQTSGPAYEKAYADFYAARLKAMPWPVVGNRVKEMKSSAQILSEALIIGQVKAGIEPAVASSHQLSSEFAGQLLYLRQILKTVVPLKDATVAILGQDVAANSVKKPDIWAARDVTLSAADKPAPVVVAIWDSGSDLSLFPAQTYTDPKPVAAPPFGPHGLAFDVESRPSAGVLYPMDDGQKAQYPSMLGDLKGFSDMQQSIDSPEADTLRKKFASIPADKMPVYLESLNFFGQYVHGTHVAGIASRGNPATRLAVGRLTFDWHNVPAKPTEELEARSVASYHAYVDWFRAHHVRVVNMSWGGGPQDYENAMELNGMGKDAQDRKTMARHLFEMDRDGLRKALQSAPEILFVCAAGNSNSDNGFDETIPSSFVLPNLLVVGAVDQAGDEASFTSYGKNVMVDANGYQVDSFVPGGKHLQLSGTSMASPNTVNLAAKLIALDPKLTPAQVVHLIVAGATTSTDGRRHNIDAKASVALLRSGKY